MLWLMLTDHRVNGCHHSDSKITELRVHTEEESRYAALRKDLTVEYVVAGWQTLTQHLVPPNTNPALLGGTMTDPPHVCLQAGTQYSSSALFPGEVHRRTRVVGVKRGSALNDTR